MDHPDLVHHATASRAYTDFFSGHPPTTLLDPSFTIDQWRSLQNLFMASHAYVFRCVYDMETHLESSIEEVKDQQNRIDKKVAMNGLIAENTRCNMLVLAKRVDEMVCHGLGRCLNSGGNVSRVQHECANNAHQSGAQRRDSNFWSPDISDSSTLIINSTHEVPRKPSVSTSTSTISPTFLNHSTGTVRSLDIDFDANVAFHTTPASAIRSFASLPSILNTISPATWPSSTASGETYYSHESIDGDPTLGPSSSQFPSVSANVKFNRDANDHSMEDQMGHNDYSYDQDSQDSSDEEEIVAMQLYPTNSESTTPSSPVRSSSKTLLDVESPMCIDADTQNESHSSTGTSAYTQSHSPLPLPRPSPTRLTLSPRRSVQMSTSPPQSPQDLSLSQSHSQIYTSFQGQEQAQVQIDEPEIVLDSKPMPKPVPLELPSIPTPSPKEAAQYDDLIRPLSPLSELTDTSINTEDEESLDPLLASSSDLAGGRNYSYENREREQEAESQEGDGDQGPDPCTGIPLTEFVSRYDFYQQWAQDDLGAAVNMTRHREEDGQTIVNQTDKEGKKRKLAVGRTAERKRGLTERMKEQSRKTQKNNKTGLGLKSDGKRQRGSKKTLVEWTVEWPEMYEGDKEDEFYRKLIECDLCSCWYHYGCAGISPGDVRLDRSEIYLCPVCITYGENKQSNKETCTRPDCGRSKVKPGEYFIAGIVGRKFRYDEKNKARVIYLVKWDGYPAYEATWENEDTLPDPHKLTEEFEEACKREGLGLATPEPILLQEAVAAGWAYVLEITDPPGERVTLKEEKERMRPYQQRQRQGRSS